MLRPYQEQAINEIRDLFKIGTKKVLLHLSTGAGKTVIFSHLLKSLYESGRAGVMVVRGRKLVDQAHVRLVRENVPHGVFMANHWFYRPHERIQICSIDTLHSRKIYPKADLVVIDEAHMAVSDSYQEFMDHYPDAYVLGVTATPYGEKSLWHIANKVVHPIKMGKLVEDGFLVAPRYFCPFTPDLKGVPISGSTHDYVAGELSFRMEKPHIVGDLVSEWKSRAFGVPTICFAVTVRHSMAIVEAFKASGIPARHIEAATPDHERQLAIDELESGKIKIISNVGILCTGVDLPWLKCIIMARPTQSYTLYIQQMGRGTRKIEGKDNFLVLDHAGNVVRHGFITDEKNAVLDGQIIKYKSKVKVCKSCFAAFMGSQCPNCGKKIEVIAQKIIKVEAGELTEIDKNFIEKAKVFAAQCEEIAKAKGYNHGWVFHRVKSKYGEAIAKTIVKYRKIPPWLLGNTKS